MQRPAETARGSTDGTCEGAEGPHHVTAGRAKESIEVPTSPFTSSYLLFDFRLAWN
jgi:hypothetical protein